MYSLSAQDLLRTALLMCGLALPSPAVWSQGQESAAKAVGGHEKSPELSSNLIRQRDEILSYQPAAGPWGALAATVFVLEPPDRAVAKIVDRPLFLEPVVWVFQGKMPDVLNMLEAFELDRETAAKFVQQGLIRETSQGIEFQPPSSFLRRLTALQRERLYPYVAPFEKFNPFHNPYFLHPSGFRLMATISPSGLSPQTMEEIESLVYQRSGKGHYFSDLGPCVSICAKSRRKGQDFQNSQPTAVAEGSTSRVPRRTTCHHSPPTGLAMDATKRSCPSLSRWQRRKVSKCLISFT